MLSQPIIQVQSLSTHYDTRAIHEDISFNVNQGEVFVILGGSGSGKSTLLRHLTRLLSPTSGEISINGTDVTRLEGEALRLAMSCTGVMFQSGALFNSLTLLDNVALPLRKFTRVEKDTIRDIARIKLGMVGLNGFEGFYPHQISGGMMKRVGVARAMALDPNILFLDEPSAGLDPVSADELDELILELNENLGTTFVVVTHELSSIFKIAHRAIMLGRGKISAEGDPHELKKSEIPWVSNFFNRQGKNIRVIPKSKVTEKGSKGWQR